jgi:hypothetical protein
MATPGYWNRPHMSQNELLGATRSRVGLQDTMVCHRGLWGYLGITEGFGPWVRVESQICSRVAVGAAGGLLRPWLASESTGPLLVL